MGLPLIELSPLQHARTLWKAPLPPALQEAHVELVRGDSTVAADPSDAHAISRAFPLTYGQSIIHLKALSATQNGISNGVSNGAALRLGVVFCGRQAPGGHNIVTGLYDALKAHNTSNVLLGFVGGTEGLFAQKTLEVTEDLVRTYRNQGGFDMLGRTKDQLRSLQQVNDARSACESLKLDALVLIGGCGTNTDAAQLAETFAAQGCHTKIIGVPVTIDGDLKNQFVETDVGFDTTCKVYSQLISNICIDALSAEKYYYFIRLMGRRTSHITMECTLQSHPNMVILAEEVSTQKLTLFDITKQICDVIQTRSENEKYHGVILLPEGLIENIPEMHALIQELDHILKHDEDVDILNISSKLSPWASALFEFLPLFIKKQLLLDRESDGSVQLSQIEMEKLLAQLVDTEISRRVKTGTYKGKKFNAICHFFGYQARGSLPSNFDCTYANALGHVAFHLAAAGLNGYMATVTNLKDDVSNWRCGGAPLTAMMSVKRWLRGPGVSHIGKPALHPAKVDLKGKPYELLAQNAAVWQIEDLYCSPGPIQFEGPGADVKAVTLSAEDQDYVGRIQEVQKYLEQVKQMVKPGCPPEVLKAALSSMASVTEVLSVISAPSYQGLRPF